MMWNDNFKIGVPAIDAQHKELCDTIDKLFAACSQGKGTDEAMKTLAFLESYTVKHFADEETLQKKSNYPKYSEHKAKHDDFIKTVVKMKKDMLAQTFNVATVIQINQVISDWLINHIVKVDNELKNYIK